jgi:hypothetical protein
MAYDLNDALQDGGLGKVRGITDAARPYKANGVEVAKQPPPNGKAKVLRFPITRFKDIAVDLDCSWAIKGLLPARGVAIVFGPTSCGKTFLTLHATLHIATGRDWAGRKTEQKRVVYILGEGQGGFGRRKAAAQEKLELPDDIPFDLITVAPNLGAAPGDKGALIDEIECQQAGLTPRVGVIVIDTLSQSLGGADENGAGMLAFVANAQAVATHFDCVVIGLHHIGKDSGRGARGHSSVGGNPDCLWEIAENGVARRTVTVVKQRDGDRDVSWDFRLNPVTLGYDKDGDPVTTLVAEITSEPHKSGAVAKPKAAVRKSRSQIAFEEAFSEAMQSNVEDFWVDNEVLVRAVKVENIRPYFAKRWATNERDLRKKGKLVSDAYRGVLKQLPSQYRTRDVGDVEWVWKISG